MPRLTRTSSNVPVTMDNDDLENNMLRKISSALAAITAAIHVFSGSADTLAPMLEAQLSAGVEGTMHVAWHIVSAFLICSVVVFWRQGEALFHFALLWIISALVFVYAGLAQDGLNGLIVCPQWTILGLTGVIAMVQYKHLGKETVQ